MSEEQKGEMSFIDHLEEFRWRVIRMVIAIVVGSIVAFLAKGFVYGTLILGPSKSDFPTFKFLCELGEYMNLGDMLCLNKNGMTMINTEMMGQFMMHLTQSFIVGFIAAFPYVFWQFWLFISPGLYNNERKVSRGATIVVTFLFAVGVTFGYYVIAPLSINFLSNYTLDASIQNTIRISSYISLLSSIVLTCGITFQLPVITYFFSRAGVMTPQFMRAYRKHAFIIILIFSAILTPPDVMSQFLIALPLYVLYQFSIGVSAYVQRQRQKKLEEERANDPSNHGGDDDGGDDDGEGDDLPLIRPIDDDVVSR